MKKLDLSYLWLALGGILFLGFILEFMSMDYWYETEPATIIEVQPDPDWGYVGEDWRTLVMWEDSVRSYVPGDLGNPGDRLQASRQSGTGSLFGILGDHRW